MLLEQITWGKADSQTPGVYNLKDCAGRCIFYLEVLNLGSLAGLQKICEPLKISAELVCACACTLGIDRNLQPSSLGSRSEGRLLPRG